MHQLEVVIKGLSDWELGKRLDIKINNIYVKKNLSHCTVTVLLTRLNLVR